MRRRRAISDMDALVGPTWQGTIWPSVQRAVAATVVSFAHKLRCAEGGARCFQLFGVDAVLNASGAAFVMECNTDPGLNALLAELGQGENSKTRMYREVYGDMLRAVGRDETGVFVERLSLEEERKRVLRATAFDLVFPNASVRGYEALMEAHRELGGVAGGAKREET